MDALEKKIVNAVRRQSGVDPMTGHRERFIRKLTGGWRSSLLFNTSGADMTAIKVKQGGFDLPQWATSAAAALLLFVFMLPLFVPSRLGAEEYLELEVEQKLRNFTNRENNEKRVLTPEVMRQAAFELEQLGYKEEIEGEYYDIAYN
jgi:hypothetical protein